MLRRPHLRTAQRPCRVCCPLCGVSHTFPGILCSSDECPLLRLRTPAPARRPGEKCHTHPLVQNHRDQCTRLFECSQIPPKAAWGIHKALFHFENPKVPLQLAEKCNFPGPAVAASSNCAKLGNTVYCAPTDPRTDVWSEISMCKYIPLGPILTPHNISVYQYN